MTRGEERAAALVRILAGIIFVAEGLSKIIGPFVRGGFEKSARGMLAESWPFWASFLRSTVLPHADAFGWVVALGELAVGVGLLVGLWTRWAAIAGALLTIVILLGQSYVPGASWDRWITAGLTTKFALLLLLLLAVVAPGRVWGFDGRMRRPYRR